MSNAPPENETLYPEEEEDLPTEHSDEEVEAAIEEAIKQGNKDKKPDFSRIGEDILTDDHLK